MKTAVITDVKGGGTYKDLFSFEYTFDNGDTVNFNHKENSPRYKKGETASYKIDFEKDNWKKGSFVDQQQNNFTGRKQYPPKGNDDARQRLIVLQSCAKVASEQYMNRGQFGTPEDIATYAIELADKLMKNG